MSNEEYTDKKVVITVNTESGETADLEGTIEVANEFGFLFRPKGKTRVDIIEHSSVVKVELVEEPAKDLKAKKLKLVVPGTARQHLLDRHGLTLTAVNALTEAEAFDYHETIDHAVADLGHTHAAKKDDAAVAAVAELENETVGE